MGGDAVTAEHRGLRMTDKLPVYIGMLLPLILICGTLLAVTVKRNTERRKQDKKRGLFE